MAIHRTTRELLHPALISHSQARAASAQNRLADRITTFAGSMIFVYVHIVWFVIWVIVKPFGDKFPFGLLTMIVSLEAIFLSTFVMISQNRADERRQALANDQWLLVQMESKQNEELLGISRQLLELTQQVHALTIEVREAVKPPR